MTIDNVFKMLKGAERKYESQFQCGKSSSVANTWKAKHTKLLNDISTKKPSGSKHGSNNTTINKEHMSRVAYKSDKIKIMYNYEPYV